MTYRKRKENWKQQLKGRSVTHEEILQTREAHVARRVLKLHLFSHTLICFSLNIAGAIKQFPLADATFLEGDVMIHRQLNRKGALLLESERLTDLLGMEGYYVVDRDASEVKKWMIELEDSYPLGILFDIDVFNAKGEKISRYESGGLPRRCFLCNEAAHVCAARRLHSIKDIQEFTVMLMAEHFQNEFISRVGSLASKALIYEISIAPKPGLVDRFNSDSHTDMDYFSLVDSIAELMPYFTNVTRQAMNFDGTPQELMKEIRFAGKEAESAMLAMTGGVNTYKGSIFSIGMICAAAGYLYRAGQAPEIHDICDTCAKMCSDNVLGELKSSTDHRFTLGQEQYQQYSLLGARGEAASGFDSVRRYGLVALNSALGWGWSLNDAGVYSLLKLISHVYDTNIIGHSDFATQERVHAMVREKLELSKLTAQEVLDLSQDLDKEFRQCNISPGGCADLLAISFLFYFFQEEKKKTQLDLRGNGS